jgi:hypothetical protein
MARFIPPDPSRGDPNTIGGYMAVHGRPAAFEGSDGLSYSVAIEADRTGEDARPWGAFFLFLRWRRVGTQGVDTHLESEFLAFGDTAEQARDALGTLRLDEVRRTLESLIRSSSPASARRWWDAMRDDDGDN